MDSYSDTVSPPFGSLRCAALWSGVSLSRLFSFSFVPGLIRDYRVAACVAWSWPHKRKENRTGTSFFILLGLDCAHAHRQRRQLKVGPVQKRKRNHFVEKFLWEQPVATAGCEAIIIGLQYRNLYYVKRKIEKANNDRRFPQNKFLIFSFSLDHISDQSRE